MNEHDSEVGASWIAALAAPWTISPHPNFSETAITPQEALALIGEHRFTRERERYELLTHVGGPWSLDLVEAADLSLRPTSQTDGLATLRDLSESGALPLGARVAAAIYASVALGRVEQADIAADYLGEVLAMCEEDAATASARLAVGILSQQRVLRLWDSMQYSDAQAEVERVLRITPISTERSYEKFPVSEGITWGAVRVQRDIAAAVRSRALSARADLEPLSGQTWVGVVRARRGWIDYRHRSMEAERDFLALRDAFEEKIEDASRVRHYMRSGPAEAGYKSLLLAEFLGGPNAVGRSREQLGKVLLLQKRHDHHSATDSLRLLRQAGATKSLQSALTWLRNEGPTDSIVDQAIRVTHRAVRTGRCSQSDLLLLEHAADFLDSDSRARAIEACFMGLDDDYLERRSGWSAHEKVWRAVGRLIPGTKSHQAVAERAFDYVSKSDHLVEPVTSRLAEVARRLDWDAVENGMLQTWQQWASTSPLPDDDGRSEEDLRVLRVAVSRSLGASANELFGIRGIELAATLANQGVSSEAGVDLEAVGDHLVGALRQEAADARSGRFAFGGYSTAEVAVAFVMRFASAEVWRAILDYLTDPSVDGYLKSSALDRIALFFDDVPTSVADELRAHFDQVLRSPRRARMLHPDVVPVFAEALRVGGVLGALSADDALRSVMQLGAGDAASRLQAARTIPFVVGSSDAAWAHALLLQLTLDVSPLVRAEASAALVRSLRHESSLSGLVRDRLRELVVADGIRVPLATIQAVRKEARESSLDIEFLRSALAAAASEAAPHIVAEAAQRTLDSDAK